MAHVPTAEGLTKALDDVHYEIQQLAFMTVRESSEIVINNAIVESRLLHVRNLLDFFEHSPRSDDDVLATHYGFPAAAIAIEEVYRGRLNKDLAHLTYSRTHRGESDKVWPHEQVIVPVLGRCYTFVEYILAIRSSYGSRTKDDWQRLLQDLAKIKGP